MESLNAESFGFLLKRTGLDLAPADAELLKPLFESYLTRLEALHDADLGDEEVSGCFLPDQSQS
ncbi:MAG: hypothetical protein V3S37_06170 [Dehalococcoidia bacterium]